jgi:hypothetical protein
VTGRPTKRQSRNIDLDDRDVDNEWLRSICAAGEHRLLRIIGGQVSERLDLSLVTSDTPVEFVRTRFSGGINLAGAKLGRLRFDRCEIAEGIDANGATIAGDLDLSHSTISGAVATPASIGRRAAIWLSEATIDGRFLAIGATIDGTATDDDRALPTRAIQADRLTVGGNIRFIQGFTAVGEVRLLGATIGGSLDLTSCSLSDPLLALDLGEATISGSLFVLRDPQGDRPTIDGRIDMGNTVVEGQSLFQDASLSVAHSRTPETYYSFNPDKAAFALRASGSIFKGEVNFDGDCHIDGLVDFRNADFESQLNFGDTSLQTEAGFALDLTSATVAGNLHLATTSTSVRLSNATIGGSLRGTGANITASSQDAVSARGIHVRGDLYLDGVSIEDGAIDLRRASISGDLNLRGSELTNPAGQTVALTYGRVEGSVYLDQAFSSSGNVRFNRSFIGGRLVCDGGTFSSSAPDPSDHRSDSPAPLEAFEAVLASVQGGMFLHWTIDGPVNLTGASTSVLSDDPTKWGRNYGVGGLSYDRLSNQRMPDTANVDARIGWLLGQRHVDATSYEQLANYYRRHGRTVDAERVLIARNRELRSERARQGGRRNVARNGIDRFWDVTVGYGFRAGRAGGLLVGLVVVTALLLALPAAVDTMRAVDEDNRLYSPAGEVGAGSGATDEPADAPCAGGRIRCFSPVFYSIDSVIPLVDLHQRSTWHPDGSTALGRWYAWGLNVAVLLGWVTTSVLVLGLTHAIGPGRR